MSCVGMRTCDKCGNTRTGTCLCVMTPCPNCGHDKPSSKDWNPARELLSKFTLPVKSTTAIDLIEAWQNEQKAGVKVSGAITVFRDFPDGPSTVESVKLNQDGTTNTILIPTGTPVNNLRPDYDLTDLGPEKKGL